MAPPSLFLVNFRSPNTNCMIVKYVVHFKYYDIINDVMSIKEKKLNDKEINNKEKTTNLEEFDDIRISGDKVLLSLNKPRTAAQVSTETNIEIRTVQRRIGKYIEKGIVRKLDRKERLARYRKREWIPDNPRGGKEIAIGDMRTPVYIFSPTGSTTEVRQWIEDSIPKINDLNSVKFIIDIAMGKHQSFDPKYTPLEKIELLLNLMEKKSRFAELSDDRVLVRETGSLLSSTFIIVSENVDLDNEIRDRLVQKVDDIIRDHLESIEKIIKSNSSQIPDTGEIFFNIFRAIRVLSRLGEDIDDRFENVLDVSTCCGNKNVVETLCNEINQNLDEPSLIDYVSKHRRYFADKAREFASLGQETSKVGIMSILDNAAKPKIKSNEGKES